MEDEKTVSEQELLSQQDQFDLKSLTEDQLSYYNEMLTKMQIYQEICISSINNRDNELLRTKSCGMRDIADECLNKLGKDYFRSYRSLITNYINLCKANDIYISQFDDQTKKTSEIKDEADKGNLTSIFQYALRRTQYEFGLPRSYEETFKYLKIGIEKDHLPSIYVYSQMLFQGEGIQSNKEEGVKYLKMAIEKGDIVSMLRMSKMYEYGIYFPVDRNESFRYTKMAADKGDVLSIIKVAKKLFYLIEKETSNKEEIISYLKKAVYYEDIESIKNYSELLHDDDDDNNYIPKNEEESIYLLKKAADLGDSESMFKYAKILEKLNKKEEARKYYLNSINSKKYNRDYAYYYARKIRKGDLGINDPKEAAKYYKISADLNHTRAMYEYACMTLSNAAVPSYPEEGVELLKKAADKNHSMAQYKLALMYKFGNGIEKNIELAAFYMKKSAENYFSGSFYSYAKMLDYGQGIQVDKKKAMDYYKMASRKHPEARFDTAMKLFIGDGIERNVDGALFYFKLAARDGDMEAKYNYEQITGKELIFDENDHYEEDESEDDSYDLII